MESQSRAGTGSSQLALEIVRVFDAPRGLVFKAWTEPEHLARWWGPRGFDLPSCRIELRTGGAYLFHMRGPDGLDHWSSGHFREVVEPELLVLVGGWVDADGKPKGPESVTRVMLEDLGAKTRLTVCQEIFESETSRDQHRRGWTSSFERLAEYLATI